MKQSHEDPVKVSKNEIASFAKILFAVTKRNEIDYKLMNINTYKLNMMSGIVADPGVITETAVETEIDTLVAEEGQTIVHCVCGEDAAYRIWASTFLIEHSTGKRAKLITAYNISFYPHWTLKNAGQKFTLIFEGLSRNCLKFDLKEEIPQEGGFEVKDILRNGSDVYFVRIG